MVDVLESIFSFLEKLILKIKKPSCISPLNYGGLGIAGLILLFSISDYIQLTILYKFIGKILGIVLPIIICLGSFDQDFKPFTHQAFIKGMLFLSSFITLMLSSSSLIKLSFSFEIFCTSSAIFVICWFSYHVITGRTLLAKIKIRLKFYLALGSTLSFFLLLPSFDVSFMKIAVASLVGSFAWVTYLIEEFENKVGAKVDNMLNENNSSAQYSRND